MTLMAFLPLYGHVLPHLYWIGVGGIGLCSASIYGTTFLWAERYITVNARYLKHWHKTCIELGRVEAIICLQLKAKPLLVTEAEFRARCTLSRDCRGLVATVGLVANWLCYPEATLADRCL